MPKNPRNSSLDDEGRRQVDAIIAARPEVLFNSLLGHLPETTDAVASATILRGGKTVSARTIMQNAGTIIQGAFMRNLRHGRSGLDGLLGLGSRDHHDRDFAQWAHTKTGWPLIEGKVEAPDECELSRDDILCWIMHELAIRSGYWSES